ncbi:hypothetical protein BCR42DRAFT_404366 [Absidia repens]|uniref:tRNA-splicing endonuclease subunit Sen2 n=1 Tax=Absidia repens TaxID=90262 RepID=A0A1X2IW22_9FUNG|nr:hypothetical protein BCR42DRAFT_404366 [Absidia repens]
MSKVKKQLQDELIPFPIHVSKSSTYNWYSILKNWLFSSSVSPSTRLTGVYMAYGRFVWILQQDQQLLYQQGHFGKGTLSRSDPTWYSRLQQSQELTPEQITVARRKQRRLLQQQRKQRTSSTTPETVASLGESQQEPDRWSMKELLEWTQGENYECSQLDLFEAFFLVYAIDALDIQDKDQLRLGIDDCWSIFSRAYSPALIPTRNMDSSSKLNMFAPHYAAYHYYRSQGWIPKDGLKFGVDFVLYQLGPSYRHAEFAVLIIPCTESSSSTASSSFTASGHQQYTSPYTWTELLRISRVCNQVKKTLVLCYVTLPLSTLSASWHLPILNQCTIRQVVMKRWSPGSNRD